MPAISFSTMKNKIISGEKKQTIRPKKSDYWLKWSEGDRLVGYWKQRTCHCEKLFESQFREDPFVVNTKDWTEELAKQDGFESLPKMMGWFRRQYGDDFLGNDFIVIRWK